MEGNNEDEADNNIPVEADTLVDRLPVVRRLISHAYYVADSGRTCNGEVIPTLRRVSLLGNDEIAPGVEQLQARYLLDDTYVDADAIADTDWPNVRAVRVWLLMRAECPEAGLNNTTSYRMGDVVDYPPTGDNFRRQLYTSTVMLRNMGR